MSQETFLQIKALLDENNCVYEHLVHEHVQTSSQAAAAIRDTDLYIGAKALILKIEKRVVPNGEDKYVFIQAVIPANEKLDMKKIKSLFDSKNASLAHPDEVLAKTGCTIGSVPPFGHLFNLQVFADPSLLIRKEIVFSAGTHTDSIKMNPQGWIDVVKPKMVDMLKVQ